MKIEKDEMIYLEGDDLRLNHPKLVAAIQDAARQIKDDYLVRKHQIQKVEIPVVKQRSVLTWVMGLLSLFGDKRIRV
jgi:hypothetical protein